MEFFARMLQQALNVAESLDVLQREVLLPIAEGPVLATAGEYSSLPGCYWLRPRDGFDARLSRHHSVSLKSPRSTARIAPDPFWNEKKSWEMRRRCRPPNDMPSVRRYHRHTLV